MFLSSASSSPSSSNSKHDELHETRSKTYDQTAVTDKLHPAAATTRGVRRRADDEDVLIGRRFRKHFPEHGEFQGRVISKDDETGFYAVVYEEDGDREELEERGEGKSGNKAWLRRRLHATILREYLEGLMDDEA